jgi:hypothetical protein
MTADGGHHRAKPYPAKALHWFVIAMRRAAQGISLDSVFASACMNRILLAALDAHGVRR